MKSAITEFPFCVIGMTEQEARKHCVDSDVVFRCIQRDGSKLVVTRDLRGDRINVAIENGIVTRAYIG